MQHKILEKIEDQYLIYEEKLGEGTYAKVHKAGLHKNPD